MALLDGMLSGLADHPAVKEAVVKVEEARNGVINAMVHFDQRLNKLEEGINFICKEVGHIEYLLQVREAKLAVQEEGIVPAAPCNFDVVEHESETNVTK